MYKTYALNVLPGIHDTGILKMLNVPYVHIDYN